MRMEEQQKSITDRIAVTLSSGTNMLLENAAQLSLGQMMIKFIDRFLWIIEKSAQWSLPIQSEDEKKKKGNGTTIAVNEPEIIRPLPWVLFLPTLIILRLVRVTLNIGATVLGYTEIEPSTAITFLQMIRRRLRTIKLNGIKNMRQRRGHVLKSQQGRDNDNNDDAKWTSIQLIRSIRLTLSSLSCLDASTKSMSHSPPPTRIKVGTNHESSPPSEEKSATESANSSQHPDSKRRSVRRSIDRSDDRSESDEEETVQAKLDRLAAADDSLENEEYNPPSSEEEENSSSTSGVSDVSQTEIQDIRAEALYIVLRAQAAVEQVIKEEPEPTRQSGNDKDDFYSPCKRSEDGETAFYSPISSKSSSPDREVPPAFEQGQNATRREDNGIKETDEFRRNGQLDSHVKTPPPSAIPALVLTHPIDDFSENDKNETTTTTTNGHTEEEKRKIDGSGETKQVQPPKGNKHDPRGRRHAYRKKK